MAVNRELVSVDTAIHAGDELALLPPVSGGAAPHVRVTDERGQTPSRQALYRSFVALQRRLGISPTWSFHRLRHAFGTHLVQLGASIEAVREMMGHADLASTSRYLHATSGDKGRAIGLLEGNYGETK